MTRLAREPDLQSRVRIRRRFPNEGFLELIAFQHGRVLLDRKAVLLTSPMEPLHQERFNTPEEYAKTSHVASQAVVVVVTRELGIHQTHDLS